MNVLAGLALLLTAAPALGFTPAQAERGEALYRATCSSCHGGTLAGMDASPPLAGGRFMANWQGQSAGALARRIRTTMPLDDPGRLGSAQAADLVAFLLSANDIPAGEQELPRTPRELELVKIVAGPAPR